MLKGEGKGARDRGEEGVGGRGGKGHCRMRGDKVAGGKGVVMEGEKNGWKEGSDQGGGGGGV